MKIKEYIFTYVHLCTCLRKPIQIYELFVPFNNSLEIDSS